MGAETNDLVVTRTFDAPVDKVWEAWTEPELIMRWWGPQGFTSPVAKMDVREGGTSLVAMRSPEGQDIYNTWTYESVETHRRMVFITRFADKDGNVVDPAAQDLPPGMPSEVRTEVLFEDLGGRTKVTVTEYDWSAGQMRDMSKMGLEQTLDKMSALLS